MSGFVIVLVKEDQRRGRKYVAPKGSSSAYTGDILNARVFRSASDAKAECCGNERVAAVSDLLQRLS